MFRDFSWFLRDCALKDYKIWSENYGELADRAYTRCMRFIALADCLHRTFTIFDLEYEYQSKYFPENDNKDY